MRKKQISWWLIGACFVLPLYVAAQNGVQKKHLSFYDTFFGNEEDFQVCYPKDHRNFFYSIIAASVAALFLLALIVYYKTRHNRQLRTKNDTIQQKNQEMLDSITYARRIQNALLPDQALLEGLAVRCKVIYRPRDIVSGDFYWVYEDDANMYFAVIDCTGHGVPGAFLSLLAHNAINKAVIEIGITDPSHILHTMNDYVKTVLKQSSSQELKDGMEIGICVVSKSDAKVNYAGANIKLYYHAGGELHEVKAAKCSVGSVQEHVVQIPVSHLLSPGKGSRLFMHSDGIVDQFGGASVKKFSTKKLKDLLCDTMPLSITEQAKAIEKNFDAWKGPQEQTDDVLLLLVEL